MPEDGWGWWLNEVNDNYCTNRFPLKYLWMLKTKSVIPVLSLLSFYKLDPVFKALHESFFSDFSYFASENNYTWKQSLTDFAEKWPQISQKLCMTLTGKEHLSPEEREHLATFLFRVSLEDVLGLDAQTMLEHGNHAIILYGPPGTGKTYLAKALARRMLNIPEPDKDEMRMEESSSLGKWQIVQFHPNYTYQDFIGGIFPDVEQTTQGIRYKKEIGVFQKLCQDARPYDKDPTPDKKFILIIDEINRAELSSVFGELMYCLEYRRETIKIPLFGDFAIPKNVYIIGTMNNTDKSLSGFDIALRRRFGFLKVMPDMKVLERAKGVSNLKYIEELVNRANNLNGGLKTQLGLPEDKQIGHAYFMKIKDFVIGEEITTYALEQLWDYHLEPLLEEYLGMEFEDKKEAVKTLREAFVSTLPQAQD